MLCGLCWIWQSRGSNKYISLKDIAERQDISRKYLESIMTELSKNELVESAIGKTGGYKLKRAPENYKVGEILYAAEGELTPVSCLAKDGKKCDREIPVILIRFGSDLRSI